MSDKLVKVIDFLLKYISVIFLVYLTLCFLRWEIVTLTSLGFRSLLVFSLGLTIACHQDKKQSKNK